MSNILDSLDQMKQLDKSNVLGSMQALSDQIADAWYQVQQLPDISIDLKKIQNIVVAGMGGSGLGPDVIKNVFKSELKVPFEITNDYHLPGYVNKNTLIILSSYSGTTEETLTAAEEAKVAGAQVLVITTGGRLRELMQENNWPGYLINAQHNPSNQPRMAIGYAVFGVIAMFTKIGLLSLTEDDIMAVIKTVRDTTAGIDASVNSEGNPAKQMAFQMHGRIPVLVGAEHLSGSIHVFQNQLNENSKNYAEMRLIPELNHHLMEGLPYPEDNEKNLFFVLFNSNLYHERTQKRFRVTQTVIEQAEIDAMMLSIDGATRLQQAFELITFGAFTNFYLAMLNGLDPTPIHTVDFFKDELKKGDA